jgi:hypothetical protein
MPDRLCTHSTGATDHLPALFAMYAPFFPATYTRLLDGDSPAGERFLLGLIGGVRNTMPRDDALMHLLLEHLRRSQERGVSTGELACPHRPRPRLW